MVCVRHVYSMETCYLHLSKVEVKEGQRVQQKTVIGASGSTGMSTGPHLHFAMKKAGAFVNPLVQTFPRADPLPKAQLADFQEKIQPLEAQLDAHSVAQVAR
jgi:murein DD-endopeptidase MepM/ murein hydrolase activator NlpD